MAPADGASPPQEASTCAHCGEPAPLPVLETFTDGLRVFCCTGCAGAARWIAESGLGDYYRWRSAPGPRIGADEDFATWDREEILDAHSESNADTRSIRLAVGGMHCAACAWLIDKALRREAGVRDVRANAMDGRVVLRWAPAEARLSTLLQRIARLGYRPSLPASAAREEERRRARNRRIIGLGIAGLGTMQAMMFAEALYLDTTGSMPEATRDAFRWITAAMSAPVVFIAGAPFLIGMVREMRTLVPGMDTLIGSGVLLAWVGSLVETIRGGPHVWYDAAVMFVFFLLAARHLEAALRANGEARLDALAGAQPAMAWREHSDDARLEHIPTRELVIGDVVRVGSGDALPCDGTLLDAEAQVDEALMTGESTPRRRRPGETLLAGSLVHGLTLRLRATAVGAATTLSQVARRVESLREQRPPLADRAETVARRVVGITLVLAIITGIVWYYIDAARAFPIALAVLVATCPCALALAVPAAIARAQGQLAVRGVLVLGSDALRRLAEIDTVVFDKTGTLTRGEPTLIDTRLCDPDSSDTFDAASARDIAARLEAAVSHPLAKAFGRSLGPPADAARLHPGEGVSGVIDGSEWRLGSAVFAGAKTRDDADEGALWLARDGKLVARFVVDDEARPDAAAAVRALHASDLTLAVFSGDAEARVAALAAQLGFDAAHVYGRLSPAGKLAALLALQAKGHRVLMVGDGVNDADVLAAADVSIAMAEGAALAQRQADLVLGGPRLGTIVEALRIARETHANIRQNLGWAIAYNVIMLPAAALGMIGPGLAALGMALSSLAVTANAWRIGRRRGIDV